ncbi:subtilisin-like serine protease [Longilinea arvoryzae]|uniref:Subtilisin-like serine protease n=1 Tax=Longilinea arvoryzae TaxID=360412 RepID=A0A0S7BCH6_9CHLR|nr:S8 family serine peptidase [Longilinea arvoryzae]GAP15535.1 subtilisin-like serine protease [Longilinea arvoryzae]
MRFLTVFQRLLFGLIILIFALSGASAVKAQSDPGDGPDSILTAQVQPLLEKAGQQGSLRVLLRVKGAFKPEGLLSNAAAVAAQRAQIGAAQQALVAHLAGMTLGSPFRFATLPLVAATLTAKGLQTALASGLVSDIQEDIPVAPTLAESTPLIGATSAWAIGYTGAGQTIAILDTGVDKTHPFLAGKVVSEACYSTTDAVHYSSSVCPGGVSESIDTGAGLPCSLEISGCDHGTHVAGIAAGNGVSFSGVAKDATLIAIKIFSRFDSVDYCGSTQPCALTWTSDQIKGLERVYELRDTYDIAAVNMSLGGGSFTTPCDSDDRKLIIDQLRTAGIVTVIASGNNGYSSALSAPACISSAVSVGSTGDGSSGATVDAISYYSNSASFLTLLAPGAVINSSIPGGGFGMKSGTSMAAPHVAGAWAVLMSVNPLATPDDIQAALVNTGLPVFDSRNYITKPRIRLVPALIKILEPFLTQKTYFPLIGK